MRHNCSFSPKNSSMVCTGGSYGLVFWKVQVVNDHKLQRINAVIGSQEDAAEDGNVLLDSISAQCWTQNNLVLAVGRSRIDSRSPNIWTRLLVHVVERIRGTSCHCMGGLWSTGSKEESKPVLVLLLEEAHVRVASRCSGSSWALCCSCLCASHGWCWVGVLL